jgi:hypothetical protein
MIAAVTETVPGTVLEGAKRSATKLRRALVYCAAAGAALWAGAVVADESPNTVAEENSSAFVEVYALGIGEHDTDEFTTVTGWRFNDSWHFGYQDGEDSGLSLVWQRRQDQMSFSHNGIRFTRRF